MIFKTLREIAVTDRDDAIAFERRKTEVRRMVIQTRERCAESFLLVERCAQAMAITAAAPAFFPSSSRRLRSGPGTEPKPKDAPPER